jgi:hypothetical protein
MGARRVWRRGLDESLAKSLLFYFLTSAAFEHFSGLCGGRAFGLINP